jgi:hypothetical protein
METLHTREESSDIESLIGDIDSLPEKYQSTLPFKGLPNYQDPSIIDRRKSLYEKVKDQISSSGKVYYPGSGADPIPYKIFGDRIIYGSLNESNYFKMLKDTNSKKCSSYKKEIENTKNLDLLKTIYADINNSPFAENSFDLIIIHGLPLQIDTKLAKKISKLLKDGGLIVLENYDDIKNIYNQFETLKDQGFIPHKLNMFEGVSQVLYEKNTNSHFTLPITKDQFVKMYQEEPSSVGMSCHAFLVLKKPK